jgi:hypothetical protein
MKRTITLGVILALAPVSMVLAAPNNVGCGVGSIIFKGQSGVAPQVLAVTTNGTLGNQTFGISSGTLGCATDGVVDTPVKVSMFIDTNMDKLAQDMSVGGGEALNSLADLIGIEDAAKVRFFSMTKAHFGEIVSSDRMSAQDMIAALNRLLAADQDLAIYARLG